MTQPELILRLVEMLMAEKEKSTPLKTEENNKDKDYMCHTYSTKWGVSVLLCFFENKKSMCSYDTHTSK